MFNLSAEMAITEPNCNNVLAPEIENEGKIIDI